MEKFYKGQQVIITANTTNHGYKIGEIVTLKHASLSDNYWRLVGECDDAWHFDADDCEPYIEPVMGFFREEDVEKTKSTTIKQLAMQLENDLVHMGLVNENMSVFEYIKYYLNK